MEKVNSKLEINLTEEGIMYLTVYVVRGKETMKSKSESIKIYSTEEAAEETAKFYHEKLGYAVTYVVQDLVFIK